MSVGAINTANRDFVFNNLVGCVNLIPWVHYDTFVTLQLSAGPLGGHQEDDMLKELKTVTQIPGQSRRRWFADDFFDLIVWYDEKNKISGFQLCYNKDNDERALTWKREAIYTHHRVDDGESTPHRKAIPVLVADGIFNYKVIADRFSKESGNLDRSLSEFVLEKILGYEISDGRLTSGSS